MLSGKKNSQANIEEAAVGAIQKEHGAFPSRHKIAQVFKKDVAVLHSLGHAQDCLMLLNSVYLAMMCVNFASSILMSGSDGATAGNVGLCLLALVPAIISWLVAGPLVVLRYSFISFVIKLRPEVLGQVIEDGEESTNLRK